MYFIQPSFLARRVYHECTWRIPNGNTIYLTFDDGPTTEVTEWILEFLSNENIKATFFCTGKAVVKEKDLFDRIIKDDHRIGNHTFNHLNGWKSNNTDYIKDVAQAANVIPSNLFRPPYGKVSKRQIRELRKDYNIIMWDILSGDFDKSISKEKCAKNVITNLRDGSIIVFHYTIKSFDKLRYCLHNLVKHATINGFKFSKLPDFK